MGASYQLAAGGTAGTLYGLNYSYEPDYGGVGNNPGAIAGLGHQMQWRANGTTQTAIGTGVYTVGAYSGAVSGSSYGSIKVSGTTGGYAGTYYSSASGSVGGMFDASGNGGDYDPTTGWHFYWNRANASLGIGGSVTSASYRAYVNGALYASSDIYAAGILYSDASARAPIFYDLNNTGYYIDPASTSITNDMRANIFYDQGNTGYYVDPNSNTNIAYLQTAGGDLLGWPGYPGGLVQYYGNYVYPGYTNSAAWNVSYYLAGNTSYGLYTNTGLYAVGSIYAAAFYYTSDESLKTNIQPIRGGLASVLAMQGVTFEWKKDGSKSIGLVAQDVEKIFPEAVFTDKETGLKSINGAALTGPIVEAIKELNAKVESQNSRILELEKEIQALQGR